MSIRLPLVVVFASVATCALACSSEPPTGGFVARGPVQASEPELAEAPLPPPAAPPTDANDRDDNVEESTPGEPEIASFLVLSVEGKFPTYLSGNISGIGHLFPQIT